MMNPWLEIDPTGDFDEDDELFGSLFKCPQELEKGIFRTTENQQFGGFLYFSNDP